MKKRILHTVLSLFLICIISTPGFAKTYKLGLVEWMPWGTAYVAAEKGFWKAEGIDVEIIQFKSYETENLKAFEYGKTDFAVLMMGNAIEMITQSPEYTIIYEHDWSHGGDMFILSDHLKSLSDLKGKRIGLYSNSAPVGFFMNKILGKAGITMKDVSLTEMTNTKYLGKAFIADKFSAIISYDPEASKVVNAGAGKLLFTSADFPGVIPEGLATQNSVMQENPGDVKKFVRGWLMAVKWQTDPKNQKDYFAIMNKTMFRDSPYSDKELKEFESGGKIHSSLDSILEHNEKGIYEYAKELLDYLKNTGADLKYSHPEKYVHTSLAAEEAKKIFK